MKYFLMEDAGLERYEYTASSHEGALNQHFQVRHRVYDADVCNTYEFHVAVQDETGEIQYFKCLYTYYIDYTPDWELLWDFSINRLEDAYEGFTGFRDWLLVSSMHISR